MAHSIGCLVGMGRQYADPVVAAATLDFLNHNKTKLMTAHAALLPQVRRISCFVHTNPYFWCFEEMLSLFKNLHYSNLVFGIKKKFYNVLMRSEKNNEVVLYCAALPTTSESSRLGRQEVKTHLSGCCTCSWLFSFRDQDDEFSSILYLTPTLQTFHGELLSVYLLCIILY